MAARTDTPGSAMVWFRNDLRAQDNPALAEAARYAAVARTGVVGLLVVSAYEWTRVHMWGLAKTDYYLRSVRELRAVLHKMHIPLVVRAVPEADWASPEAYYANLGELVAGACRETGCDALYMNCEYDGASIDRDARVVQALAAAGILHHATHDQCAVPVGKLATKSGTPFKVFSQFKKSWVAYIEEHGLRVDKDAPLPLPAAAAELLEPGAKIALGELPDPREMFDEGAFAGLRLERVREAFPAGERAAQDGLAAFLKRCVQNYHEDRNHFLESGASRMSAPLAVGAISLKQCLTEARAANGEALLKGQDGLVCWISELCWRDFYRHVLHHFPHVGRGDAFRPEFQALPWRGWAGGEEGGAVEDEFARWCEGRTGVPIVDAAMRQIATEGWQSNRVRMVVAMYLTKDLLIHWRRGERFFMQHLIDYDYPSNNGGWQWSASTGTDAQPYFRIFNPLLQSEKFDRDGSYIRTYVPELAAVPSPAVHDPAARLSKADFAVLHYPRPIIDHTEARDRTLALFTSFTKSAHPIKDGPALA